jgi:hypothetical protein
MKIMTFVFAGALALSSTIALAQTGGAAGAGGTASGGASSGTMGTSPSPSAGSTTGTAPGTTTTGSTVGSTANSPSPMNPSGNPALPSNPSGNPALPSSPTGKCTKKPRVMRGFFSDLLSTLQAPPTGGALVSRAWSDPAVLVPRHAGETVAASLLIKRVDDQHPHDPPPSLTSAIASAAWFQDGFMGRAIGFRRARKQFRRGTPARGGARVGSTARKTTPDKKKVPCWSEAGPSSVRTSRGCSLQKRADPEKVQRVIARRSSARSGGGSRRERSAGSLIFAARSQVDIPEVVIDLAMDAAQRHLA